MTQLLDSVGSYLNQDTISQLSQSIGADSQRTEQAISAALPTLLGALTRSADGGEKEAQLHRALSNDHDGSILDHLGSLFGGKKPEAAAVSDSNALWRCDSRPYLG